MARLHLAQAAMRRERERLEHVLCASVAATPPPEVSRMGLAWGDYLRQIIALCVGALNAFFAFILALWAPGKINPPCRNERTSRWNELVRQEMDLFHECLHAEVVSACRVVRGNHKKVTMAALDLLERECQPLRTAIDQHFSANRASNDSGLRRLISVLSRTNRGR
jgi:hypothetical protein